MGWLLQMDIPRKCSLLKPKHSRSNWTLAHTQMQIIGIKTDRRQHEAPHIHNKPSSHLVFIHTFGYSQHGCYLPFIAKPLYTTELQNATWLFLTCQHCSELDSHPPLPLYLQRVATHNATRMCRFGLSLSTDEDMQVSR